jgi:hypothetical protein
MTPEEFNLWSAVANKTAWKEYSEKVKGGKELLEKALAAK